MTSFGLSYPRLAGFQISAGAKRVARICEQYCSDSGVQLSFCQMITDGVNHFDTQSIFIVWAVEGNCCDPFRYLVKSRVR